MFLGGSKHLHYPHRETLQDLRSVARKKKVSLHVHTINATIDDVMKNYPIKVEIEDNLSLRRREPLSRMDMEISPIIGYPTRPSIFLGFEVQFENNSLKKIIVKGILSKSSNEF